MDVGRALTYLFRDPRWVRTLGIVALLGLPPTVLNLLRATLLEDRLPGGSLTSVWFGGFVGLAAVPVSGYGLRLVRGAAAGADLPLPAWSDPAGLLRDGLKRWGVTTLWGMPGSLFTLARDPGDRGGLIVLDLVLGLVVLISLVAQPAAEARLATTGSFATGLDVGAALGSVRRNLRGYVLLVLATLVLGSVAAGLGTALVWLVRSALGGQPGVRDAFGAAIALGPATWGAYGLFFGDHLVGQAYRGWRRVGRRKAQRRPRQEPAVTVRRPTRRRRS